MGVDPIGDPVVEDDVGTGLGEPDRDGPAHGAAGTCHDGDLARQEALDCRLTLTSTRSR